MCVRVETHSHVIAGGGKPSATGWEEAQGILIVSNMPHAIHPPRKNEIAIEESWRGRHLTLSKFNSFILFIGTLNKEAAASSGEGRGGVGWGGDEACHICKVHPRGMVIKYVLKTSSRQAGWTAFHRK